MAHARDLSGDEQELLAALAEAQSSKGLRAVLDWPSSRLSRTIRRLEEARLIRTGSMGRELFVSRWNSRLPRPGRVRDIATLSIVLTSLAEEGWTVRRRHGHQADLINGTGVAAVVAVYPSGIHARSLRSVIRRLAGAATIPEFLFVYTARPGPLQRAYWPKVSKPSLVIRELRVPG